MLIILNLRLVKNNFLLKYILKLDIRNLKNIKENFYFN